MQATEREQWAWAAGFFDGEGCIGCYRFNKVYATPYLKLTINQKDRQVLDKFQTIFPFLVAKVYCTDRAEKGLQFTLASSKLEHIQAIMAMMWPWLSRIKRDDFARAMNTYNAAPRRRYWVMGDKQESNRQKQRRYRERKKAGLIHT